MHVTRLYQRLSLFLFICVGFLAGLFWGTQPTQIRAQVSDPCIVKVIPYGQPIPAEQLFTSKTECEKGFLTQCLPDGATVGQTGKCCSGKSYQSGNIFKCGVSTVTATTCKVGGITMSAGGTACGAQGDTFEYVCVANGTGAVGSNVDDTGASVLQRRTCKTGWACKNNACAPLFSDITLGSPALPIVRSGEICNETGGCTCFPSGSLSGSSIKKFDVCGGSSTIASQATCTSQCVAGNSCPGTSTNGVGSCPVNFKCCAPLSSVVTQSPVQEQCLQVYNSTGQITSLACEQYLVASGATTQAQINSTRGQRAVEEVALQTVAGVADRVAINGERFNAVTQALNQGKIDAVTASALYAYIATDLVSLGQLDTTNNSVQFAKQQCQISTPAACAAHWAGAFGNSLALASEIVPGVTDGVVATLNKGIPQGNVARSVTDDVLADLRPHLGSTTAAGDAQALSDLLNGKSLPIYVEDGELGFATPFSQRTGDSIFLNDIEGAVQAVQRDPTKPLILFGHSDGTSIKFGGQMWTGEEVGNIITDLGLPTNCTVLVFGCDTGNQFAGDLAATLDANGLNATVTAPLGELSMSPGGQAVVIINGIPTRNNAWVTYEQGQSFIR